MAAQQSDGSFADRKSMADQLLVAPASAGTEQRPVCRSAVRAADMMVLVRYVDVKNEVPMASRREVGLVWVVDEQHHYVWAVAAAAVAVDMTGAVGIAGMIVREYVRNWWQPESKSLQQAVSCLAEVIGSRAVHVP